MKRKIIATIAGCFALCAAQAANVVVPVSISATGTVKRTSNVTNVALSDTNWVSLVGMYVTVPAGTTGAIELASGIGGSMCVLDTVNVSNSSTNGTEKLMFLTPRRPVWPNVNPAVDRYPIVGTNFFLGVTQGGTTTNAYVGTNTWAIQLLIEQ